MTQTMLERAARAAYETPHGPRRLWSDLSDRGKDLAVNQARAVLMAVREPSDDLANKACQPIADTVPFNPCPREAFTAMIDAILSEGQP